MARLKLSPTRSNLISVRQRLKLARRGFELLDRKRDVLVMEILDRIEEAEEIQREMDGQFQKAYAAIEEARAVVGTERLHRMVLSRPKEMDVHITPQSIMGVQVPSLTYRLPEQRLLYGLGDTSVVLDQAQQEWENVLVLIGDLAQKVTTVWLLALELRRTQKRANALENIFIPSYQETLTYIEGSLEQKEREELFRIKRAKAKLEEKEASD